MEARPNRDLGEASVEPLVVDVKSLARMLSCSVRSLWRRLAAGQLPKPVRIGRSVRWELATVREWIAKGCPGSDAVGSRRETQMGREVKRD
jgi:predicted DNA-binding transcriptional regulator AlpA